MGGVTSPTDSPTATIETDTAVILPAALERLVASLRARGYRVLGPTVRDGAIVYDDLGSAAELPIGWTDHQDAGSYRLERRPDEARFGYAVGPHSWKRYLFAPRVHLWRASRDGGVSSVEEEPLDESPFAFVGVRPCELRAIEIQDRVFVGGRYVDRDYAARREGAFVVAVNCFEPAGTCFCTSMGTGPKARSGYDLSLTELLDGEHRFLVEVGSERGAEVLAELAPRPAVAADVTAAAASVDSAAQRMGRTMDTRDVRDLLMSNLEHPRWNDVAERCLSCGNCTLACPTCFCSAVEDTTDLAGDAERWRVWDTCFSVDYSYIHGGSIRPSGASRYRQWMTHKLGTWFDQFGSSGCVGCGRCITWCPVGIDITEEVAAIRATQGEDDALA
jgi:ferredoxin